MGLFDRFKTADNDAPEGDDVDLSPQLENENVLNDDEAVEPETDVAVQDPEADQSIPDGVDEDA